MVRGRVKKIIHVVGARPNFMKVSPVLQAISRLTQGRIDGTESPIRQLLVHTGQHYDVDMSEIFFRQLGMPEPDVNLEVGAGSHAVQTAEIMKRFEKVILDYSPDLLLVYGDVNSTIAAALVAVKLGVKVGHVEAGLRSRDWSMPEEINRVLTDRISNFFFTPSKDADENLKKEGMLEGQIFLVGNVMIDTLIGFLPLIRRPDIPGIKDEFIVVTLHRPSNVDSPEVLHDIISTLDEVSLDVQVIFPVHPRTRTHIEALSIKRLSDNFKLTDPLGYLEFLFLQKNAIAVITDSGGIQEETTFMQKPCLTVRENTERPITVTMGTNVLVGQDMRLLKAEVKAILSGMTKRGSIPPLWDGKAGERIAQVVLRELGCEEK
jgi:UDP-N-acetylglucosamine 2-epimerase (non-hydrolysing)